MRDYIRPLILFFLCFLPLNSQEVSSDPVTQWDADNYAENGFLQAKWAQKFFFDRYKLSGSEHVLDIGCGDGRLTQAIAFQTQRGKVIGIDNSESMISYAKEKFGLSPNLTFEVIDAADSAFYARFAEAFDLVVSFHCLHWVADQQAALNGISVTLKPGGKAFLRLTSKGWDPVQEIADSLIQSSKWGFYFAGFRDPVHRYNIEEYTALVEQAGLQIVRIEEVFEDDFLASEELLGKQIKSWLPHLKYLPAHLQNAFLEDIVNHYLQEFPAEEGRIHLYDCYLEVELKKLMNLSS